MRKLFVFLLILFLFQTGCAEQRHSSMDHGEEPHIQKHFTNSVAQMTENAHYSLEMVIPEKQFRMGVNTFELIVHDKAGKDVAGAEVSVTPWMPGMGHGVMQQPAITERGGGLYSVSNVVFSMTGHWQLNISVAKDDVMDKAVFDFPTVQIMGHEHGAMAIQVPKNLNTATSNLSDNKLFEVSYENQQGKIQINRIQSWKLDVKTAGGQPISNAKITLVGDMPEHGHGFPTSPEIVQGEKPGEYFVEGIKFSMPGWWVVTFHIVDAERMDSVTFNLVLK